MSSTRALAGYLSRLKYENLPADVVEKGKLSLINSLGNSIGGYPLTVSKTFLELSKDLGIGRPESTLIGDGTKVSVSGAAFGNGGLSTMLDHSDYFRSESGRCWIWPGALAVPAALAAGEAQGISGKELIVSAVAGYECSARILTGMDMTLETTKQINGETISTFAAAGAAGRAFGLDEDEMLSTLGMAGTYTVVPGWYKWVSDEGLSPRKDIKQGWAFMCMAGAFAAVSAKRGLRMVQENNILDGQKGLSRMLSMDSYNEERVTEGFGETFHIREFASKFYPGGAVAHPPIVGVRDMIDEHGFSPEDIDTIEVGTAIQDGVGFDDPDPHNLSEMQFSLPYMLAAALFSGTPGGPDWFVDATANDPRVTRLSKRVTMTFDDECQTFFNATNLRLSKVTVTTKSGQQYYKRVEHNGEAKTPEEIRDKFIGAASQVIERKQVDEILDTIGDLETVSNISKLTGLLAPFPAKG
jgi:2-methylcitrate dehydratase PrpD